MTMLQHVALFGIVDFGVWDALRDIILLLLAALLLGTIAERLGQSVIVGYLIAGTLVGPNVLGWISKQQEIFYIAELGVALLLFVIGLEFSPRRLLDLGKKSLGTGVAQILVTATIAWIVAGLVGIGIQEAIVIGMMVAMSSTACVLRLLKDRVELDGIHGRAALAILLVQDVAVVPMVLVVSAMAGKQPVSSVAANLALSVALAVALIGTFYCLLGYVVPWILKSRDWKRNRDLPILLAMILAFGCAWGAHEVKLSPALGAFAGGVLLAVSPFATQIRADVRPMSTVLVTLFFASIGMFGDPWWLLQNLGLVTAIVMSIVVGKPLVIAVWARAFGQPWRYAVATGLCLAQIGEFSFVLATVAHTPVDGVALMQDETFRALVSATIISLLLTPYLVAIASRAGSWFDRLVSPATALRDQPKRLAPTNGLDVASDEILIIGFGPAGQRVADGLISLHQYRIVVIDLNQHNIDIAHRNGLKGVLGDATQTEVLEHAGISGVRVVAIVLPDHNTTRQLIYQVRDLSPNAHIIARCRYHMRHWELISAGAHELVDEEDEVGKQVVTLVKQVLPASATTT